MIDRLDQFLAAHGVDLGCIALLIVAAIFARGLPFIVGSMAQ